MENDINNTIDPLAWSRLSYPYIKRQALDPEKLGSPDRLLFNLQQGVPLKSHNLPLPWKQVKQTLFNFAAITLDELRGREATKWIQDRYEDIRVGVEAFFSLDPDIAVKQDSTFTLAEGFDVFDKPTGIKYWKHRRHSIVNSTKLRPALEGAGDIISNLQRGKIPDSDICEEGNLAEAWTTEGEVTVSADQDVHSMVNADDEDAESTICATYYDTKQPNFIDLKETCVDDYETTSMMDITLPEPMMEIDEVNELLSTPEESLADITSYQLDQVPVAGVTANCMKTGDAITTDDPLKVRVTPETPKSKAVPLGEVTVYEDQPGRTPTVKSIVDQNPPSPGTDLPIENLDNLLTSSQRSNDGEVSIPQTNRYRPVIVTPAGLSLIRPALGRIARPFESFFSEAMRSES